MCLNSRRRQWANLLNVYLRMHSYISTSSDDSLRGGMQKLTSKPFWTIYPRTPYRPFFARCSRSRDILTRHEYSHRKILPGTFPCDPVRFTDILWCTPRHCVRSAGVSSIMIYHRVYVVGIMSYYNPHRLLHTTSRGFILADRNHLGVKTRRRFTESGSYNTSSIE